MATPTAMDLVRGYGRWCRERWEGWFDLLNQARYRGTPEAKRIAETWHAIGGGRASLTDFWALLDAAKSVDNPPQPR